MTTVGAVDGEPRELSVPAVHRRRRTVIAFVAVTVLLVLVLGTALVVGSETVPVRDVLRWLTGSLPADDPARGLIEQFHLPRALTGVLAGAGLAVVGLVMQTLFANPLADPYILGVSSGAGLGVAVSVLGTGNAAVAFVSTFGVFGRWGTTAAAMTGALVVMGVVLLVGRWISSVVSLLVIGVMIGAAVGAAVSLLLAFADPVRLQKYVLWSLGSLDGTYLGDLVVLGPVVGIGLVLAVLLSPSLNALVLGERYARTMGVRVRGVRVVAIVATSVICGGVTAFCGPIAFLGLAVPHLARMLLRQADHRIMVPFCALLGAVVCVLCGVIAALPGTAGTIPLNVVTAVLGAPVVIALLIRNRTLGAGG